MAVIGETIEIEVTVKDTAGTVVDLTNATGIIAALYFNGSKIIGQWSLIAKTGFDTLALSATPTDGIFTCYLQTTESLTALPKSAKMEVQVSFANVNFDSNQQINIDTDIELEAFEPSVFRNVTPF